MMRVIDTVQLKGLGLLACVESDGPCPLNGSQLRRVADGQIWTVKGVERYGIHLGTPGRAGEKIGVLLSDGPEPAIGDELKRVEDPPLYGQNLHNEARRVAHASLTKLSGESDFKVKCPACQNGMLLVGRNQETLALVRNDRCISCAQSFVYTDESIGVEPLEPEPN